MLENTGLVLEGGGFRAIFIAAALEVFHKHNWLFPYTVGVSAGAAYGVSYVSRQQGRNIATNKYINDKRYCGMKHLLKSGNYFNWEFMYKHVPSSLLPLDYTTLEASSTRFYAAVTNCKTAQSEYLPVNTSSADRLRDVLTATSSLPFISKMKEIDNRLYLDGGLANPVPVEEAFCQNNKRLVVVLTRPKGYRKKEDRHTTLLFKLFYRKYPKLVQLMQGRTARYNRSLEEMERLASTGKIFVVQPQQPVCISRLENNPKVLEKVYFDAVKEIEQHIFPSLKAWLERND